MQLVVDDVHVSLPFAGVVESAAVTVYPVIALPSSNGAVHETTADCVPPVAVTPVGGSGTFDGMTPFDATDGLPVPAPFVAVTVKT